MTLKTRKLQTKKQEVKVRQYLGTNQSQFPSEQFESRVPRSSSLLPNTPRRSFYRSVNKRRPTIRDLLCSFTMVIGVSRDARSKATVIELRGTRRQNDSIFHSRTSRLGVGRVSRSLRFPHPFTGKYWEDSRILAHCRHRLTGLRRKPVAP